MGFSEKSGTLKIRNYLEARKDKNFGQSLL